MKIGEGYYYESEIFPVFDRVPNTEERSKLPIVRIVGLPVKIMRKFLPENKNGLREGKVKYEIRHDIGYKDHDGNIGIRIMYISPIIETLKIK